MRVGAADTLQCRIDDIFDRFRVVLVPQSGVAKGAPVRARNRITDVNKEMEALTGCTRDELIGAPFKSYFTDPDQGLARDRGHLPADLHPQVADGVEELSIAPYIICIIETSNQGVRPLHQTIQSGPF
jgi:PAS domain-containing protein